MKKVLCMYNGVDACGQHRIIIPYTNIKSDTQFLLSRQYDSAWIDDDNMVSAVILQRPADETALQFIKDFQGQGGIAVVETDDELNNIPYSNPAHEYFKGEAGNFYQKCLLEAKYVHCSTPELAKSKKYIVFPNAIDLEKYTDPLPKQYDVMWSGSPSHYDSLELIRPAVAELLQAGKKVFLMSNKEWLETIFKPHENLTISDWVSFGDHHKIPSLAKVNLTPLPDNSFNRNKSELKILESAAWKIPSVSSKVAPYIRFNKESEGGNLIVHKERTDNWLESIYALLQDESLYLNCAMKSYNCVKEKYSLSVINEKRQLWWKSILGN